MFHGKRFLNLIFGITATAFGIANNLQIAKLNSIMAKEVARTDMLVDITQLHENHLHSLDIQMNNSANILTDFVKFNPAVASQALTGMLMHVNEVQTKIEDCLDQAQLHRLSHKIFTNDVLESIKANIDATAKRNGFLSFVTQTTDSKAGTAIRDPDRNAPTEEIPEVVIIVTGTGNTAFTARSRTTRKKNAERE